MNERIHRYLDGELRQEELTVDELRAAAPFERIIRETAEAHRSIETPDLTAGVMARLAELEDQESTSRSRQPGSSRWDALRRPITWLWTPRPIRLRPAWGALAMAAALVVFILPGGPLGLSGLPGSPDPVGSASQGAAGAGTTEAVAGTPGARPAAARVFIQFRLDAPEASEVRLAGSFSEWQPRHRLHQTAGGVWSILVPLEPGVHDYAFIVDGEEWVVDPVAPRVDDGFGGVNSRLSVLLPEGSSQT